MYQGDFPEIMVPVFDNSLGSRTVVPSFHTEQSKHRSFWSSIMPFNSFKNIFSRHEAALSEKPSLWLPNGHPAYKKVSDVESSIASDTSSLDDSSLSESSTSSSREKAKCKIDARVISDAIIGLSDGLTVPFALTAGLSTLGSTQVVIYGGMAELIAGAISMGLGGYLGAKSEEYVLESIVPLTLMALMNWSENLIGPLETILASTWRILQTRSRATSRLSSKRMTCPRPP